MAEEDDSDESQKTEEPTARKLEEARKKGQVVVSKEINSWVILLMITIIATSIAAPAMIEISQIFKEFLAVSPLMPAEDFVAMRHNVTMLFIEVGRIVLVPILMIAVAAGLAGFAQVGPLFTTEPIKPDLSKISIIKGFGRVFSIKAIVEFIKGLIKISIIAIVIYICVKPYMAGIEHFIGQPVIYAMFDMKIILTKILVAILSILFFVAVADYMFQRYQFIKQMRMTKQEIKEEYKQTEGDPHIKGKLRQLRERKARERMMQNVPKADVVITNPTHYAVALQYNMEEMQAPVMVAKGVDNVALRIKELAKDNNVTIIENPILARALYDSMEIDQMIPEEHFKAVAEVISYVFKLKGKV